MWDYVVFKKQRPLKKCASSTGDNSNINVGIGGKTGKGGNNKKTYKEFMKKKYEDLDLEEDFDKLYRPIQKASQ